MHLPNLLPTLLLTLTLLTPALCKYPHQAKSDYDAQTLSLAAKGACRFYYIPGSHYDFTDNHLDTCIPACGTNDPKRVKCEFDKQRDQWEEKWFYDPNKNLWGLGYCACQGAKEWFLEDQVGGDGDDGKGGDGQRGL